MPEPILLSDTILTTDDVTAMEKPDVALVVQSTASDIDAGDLAVFKPYTGTWIKNPAWCDGAEEVHVHTGMDDSIMAKVDMTKQRLALRGSHVLIARQPAKDCTECGVIVPEGVRRRTSIAKVLEVGPDCTEVKPGDVILQYTSRTLLPVRLGDEVGSWYGYAAEDLAFIQEFDIGLIESQD